MQFLSPYGVARHIYIPIVKRAVVDFAVSADWTPAAGDVKISKDGGAAANVTNLPTAITMGNTAMWDFSLTATEMQAAQVMVSVADSATKAVEDQFFIIETYANASAQHVCLPNVAPGASGGLLISGSNSGTTTFGAVTCTGTFTVSDGIAVTRSSANTSAISATGNGTGHGLSITSGSGATGNGINVTSSATNGHAVNAAGAGTGDGLKSTGGATDHAFELIGGGTSGDGLKVTTTSGHGFNIAATGTDKHGITSTGGNGGTSDGIKGAAGTGGVDIRGNLTGNVTGNLSGSVGSVTGAVGSVTGNVGGNVTGSVGSVANGGIAAASFAAGAIDASAIAADAIGSSELAASAATEIANAVAALSCTE